MSEAPDPRKAVEILNVSKRGEWYTVEGVDRRTGKKTSVDIPAPSLESHRTRAAAESYLRRSIFGASRLSDRPNGDDG